MSEPKYTLEEAAAIDKLKKQRAKAREDMKSRCKLGKNCLNFDQWKSAVEGMDKASAYIEDLEHTARKNSARLAAVHAGYNAEVEKNKHRYTKLIDGAQAIDDDRNAKAARIVHLEKLLERHQDSVTPQKEVKVRQVPKYSVSTQTDTKSFSNSFTETDPLKIKLIADACVQTDRIPTVSSSTQAEQDSIPTISCSTQAGQDLIDAETQTDPKVKKEKVEISVTDSSTETMPLRNMYCFQVVKLRFKLAYNRIWLSNYEKSIKAMVRFVMRARAEKRKDLEPEEPSSSGAAPIWQQINSLQATLQNEVAQMNSQLVTIDLELTTANELSNKAAEDVRRLQTAIDELRSETLEMQISNAADLNLVKKDIRGIQTTLAEVRQSTFELENGLKTIPLDSTKTTLSILEKSLISSSVQECLEKLQPSIKPDQMSEAFKIERKYQDEQMKELKAVIEANTMNELKKLQLDEESRLKGKDTSFLKDENVGTHLDAACQTGFTVDNYEYSSLIRAAGEIHKFDTTLIKLEGKAQNVGLELNRQEQVMQEARSLISELRLITRDNLDAYVKMKRADDDTRLVRVEAERRQTKASNKKARLQVARHMSKERESQIKAEIDHTTPKIVEFVREWNSLQAGDIFLYRGLKLVVDETFNPSIRITHTGQEGNKWEAQKYANINWYNRGVFDLKK